MLKVPGSGFCLFGSDRRAWLELYEYDEVGDSSGSHGSQRGSADVEESAGAEVAHAR